MGIHTLLGLYFAVFSVSALAADPPVPRGNVSVTVNPTTGYYSSTNSTVRLPNGVSVSPTGGVPVVSKYSGGLQQTIPTGITIDAIKKSAPLPAVVRAKNLSLKTAAKGLLHGNLAGLALGAGLNSLLNGIGALIDGDGNVVLKQEPPSQPCVAGSACYSGSYGGLSSQSQTAAGVCSDLIGNLPTSSCSDSLPQFDWFTSGVHVGGIGQCYVLREYHNRGGNCQQSNTRSHVSITKTASGFEPPAQYVPIPPLVLDDAVDSSYNPEPSDWQSLTRELKLDDVEITSTPTLSSNPKTTTIYDANGNPVEVQETNIWYDFDIRDNPSKSPALDLKVRQETKTYKNGALTGTTTTTDTDSAGAAGGGGSSVDIDIPTDCEFMPTVCAFLDWFKNDDTPEDPDLSALIDNRDFTETYSITGGSKQCPADYEFTVDFIGRTYGLSFEPACDFASKMYYFVMAAAYIFAAYITIGASRNG